MASIKDVAEIAGVSTATVSRVLSEHPHVRSEVRERVLAAVAQLEYRPNLVARSLRSQQSNTIGLIVSDIRNPFFTAISRAVEDAAYERGFSVLLCNTDENPEKEVLYLDVMRAEQVGGVIFSPTRHTLDRFGSLNLDFPTVLIDRSLKRGEVDAVVLDNVAAAHDLTTHLLEQGYRRVGGLFGAASTTGRERKQGFELALREHGFTPDAEYAKSVPPTTDGGCCAALELLSASQPPDAIVTSNSLLAAGAIKAIRQRKLRIPEDVALGSFDATTWTSLIEPPLTVMAQPIDEIGRTATELLLQRIADPQRSPRKVILQATLHVGGSSAPRS